MGWFFAIFSISKKYFFDRIYGCGWAACGRIISCQPDRGASILIPDPAGMMANAELDDAELLKPISNGRFLKGEPRITSALLFSAKLLAWDLFLGIACRGWMDVLFLQLKARFP